MILNCIIGWADRRNFVPTPPARAVKTQRPRQRNTMAARIL